MRDIKNKNKINQPNNLFNTLSCQYYNTGS